MNLPPAPFRRLLVPVDFSSRSANALQYAVAFGSLTRAQVDVLHVWHSDLSTPVTVARDRAKGELRSFVSDLELRGDVELRRRTDHGDPYMTIQSAAQLSGYDLIVVAGPEPQRVHADSVARGLLRAAPSPVLFVPAYFQARYRSDEERVLKLERLLVPLALSGSRGQALRRAELLGTHDDAAIEQGASDEDAVGTARRVQASRIDLVVVCGTRARPGDRPSDGRAEAVALASPCATLSLPD